jgi:hypothetical protein
VNLAAGLFLLLFGGLGVWMLRVRFPRARFMQSGYLIMALGGLALSIWAVVPLIACAIVGFALLLSGCVCGIIGALRKELRGTR